MTKIFKDKIAQLKSSCTDARLFDTLMDDILSIQKQMCVEPTLIHIPVKDIVKEYDFEHFKITRTKYHIVFHAAGMSQVVGMQSQTLYGHLYFLLGLKDKYDAGEIADEEKDLYEAFLNATVTILLNPTICFCDDDYWTNLATTILKEQNILFDKMFNQELKDEDIKANMEFENRMEVADMFEKAKEDMEQEKQEEEDEDEHNE